MFSQLRFLSSSIILLTAAIAVLTSLPTPAQAARRQEGCVAQSAPCQNQAYTLQLKIFAIFTILGAGFLGIWLPLVSRFVPALNPNGRLLVIVKAFSGGVILATGFMHLFPDSLKKLTPPCLPLTPWGKFPFVTFIAMLTALLTLVVVSLAASLNERLKGAAETMADDIEDVDKKIMRYRFIAMLLELSVVAHSVLIGLSLGSSRSPCTIRSLVIAVWLHQFLEGVGLGGCMLQADYKTMTKTIMVFFFSITNPFGITIGMGLSSTLYSEDRPTLLIIEGLLNAASAGTFNYMAMVDLLSADFMGARLQSDLKLRTMAYIAVFLGVASMSLLAIFGV